MISGTGSANAAVVGTITIPLMMRYGVPGTFAAAVETAASMGGLIMPPMMGVGAFLMSEFLGVPYWDVVHARLRAGVRLLRVDRASRSICCACGCCRATQVAAPQGAALRPDQDRDLLLWPWLFLLYLMGWVGTGELLAALYTAGFMFGCC